MSSKLFNTDMRIESKYISDAVNVSKFIEIIRKEGFIKSYPRRAIFSLYFDDPFLKTVSDNLAGASPRSKYRLRWYKNNELLDYGWQFEIKKKLGISGYKSIYKIPEDFKFNLNDVSNNYLYKLKNEFEQNFIPSNFKPKIYCNYIREYYELNKKIRLTIDSRIRFHRFRPYDLLNEFGWQKSNYHIIELKFPLNTNKKFLSFVKDFPQASTRCSKYLLGHAKVHNLSYI